jgi:hypothetical protein
LNIIRSSEKEYDKMFGLLQKRRKKNGGYLKGVPHDIKK